MKKGWFLLLFLLWFCSMTWGQEKNCVRKLNLAFESGISVSEKRGAGDVGHPEAGYRFSISSFRFISDRTFISSAISVVYDVGRSNSSSNQFSNPSTPKDISITEHDTWIAVPLHYNYVFAHRMNKRYFLGIGLEERYLLTSNALIGTAPVQNSNTISAGNSEVTIKSFRNDYNTFVSGRVGYIAHIFGRDKILLSLNYQLGLFEMVKSQKRKSMLETIDHPYHLETLTFSISYLF